MKLLITLLQRHLWFFIFGILLFTFSGIYSQSFRYLQFNIIQSDNLQLYEIEFYSGGQMLPARMSSANQNGVDLSSTYHADWEVVYPFDGDNGTNAYTPNCDGIVTHTITIDLGEGNSYEFDSVYIDKRSWNTLTHFKVFASTDGTVWEQMLDTLPANPTWSGYMAFPLEVFIDADAPSAPSNVSAGFLTSQSVTLFWDQSTDNIGVIGYEVSQNGVIMDTVVATSINVTGLNASTSYSYTIKALDMAGNASSASTAVEIITSDADSENPSTPTNVTVDATSEDLVEFSWDASMDNVGVIGYIIYLDNEPIGTTDQTEFAIPGLQPETSYGITVRAKDATGNFSTLSSVANFSTMAVTPGAKMKMSTNFNGLWDAAHSDPFIPDHDHVTTDNPWNSDMMNDLTAYYTLRFMQYEETNGGYVEDNWNERTQKLDSEQQPMAHEWKMDLCNRLKKNPWICINHTLVDRNGVEGGTNNYLKKLAILLKTGVDMKDIDLDQPQFSDLVTMTRYDFIAAGGIPVTDPLDPSLRVYVEYSNETWNGYIHYIPQQQHCYDEGNALGLGGADDWGNQRRFHAWANLRIWEEMEAVFGENSPHLMRVDAYFILIASNLGDRYAVYENATYNPNGIYPDAFSPGPYFGHSVDGNAGTAAADLRAAMTDPTNATRALKQSIDQKATEWGHPLQLIAYEGGQHITTNADGINSAPEIYNIYLEYLDSMNQFYDEFAHFVHSGTSGSGQAFGAKVGWEQDLADAHKWRAILDWMGTTTTTVDMETPSVPANLSASTITSTSIAFSWDASTDNDVVESYKVFRNGILIGTTSSTSYTIGGLSPDNDYVFTVAAKDASGNVSAQSTELQASTLSTTTYSLTITVNDGTNPLSGATVTVNGVLLMTNGSGQVTFSNVIGTGLPYVVSFAGYQPKSGSVNVTNQDESLTVSLVESNYYNVTFTISNNVQVLEGATIDFNAQSELSDVSGQAVFTNVEEGVGLAWQVSLTNYHTASGTFNLRSDTVVNILLTPEVDHDIIFRVTDGTNALEGATIHFNSQTATTDDYGLAIFLNVAENTGQAWSVTLSGYETASGTVDVDDDKTVDVTLTAGANTIKSQYSGGVKIYPNPASNCLNISGIQCQTQIKIVALNGTVVYEDDIDVNNKLDISTLISGLYIIQLINKEGIEHHGLMKY